MPDEPQRFCLGIGYMPGPDPRITKGADGGRDWISEAELEKAAWSFLRNGPQVNAFHMAGTEGIATVVESSIHRGPDWDLGDGIVVTKGTWLIGAILEPKAWQMALDGKVNGWSPEGTAHRRMVRKEGAVAIAKSASPDGDDEEFSELTGCDFPTMGLVGKGANGIPRWLVMKNADGGASGLFDAGFVRDLIGKQADEPDPEPRRRERNVMPNGVTITASPADLAAFLRKARQDEPDDDVAKAALSGKDRNDLPDSDFAYIEPGGTRDESGKTTPRSKRHFPVQDAAHVRNALTRIAAGAEFGDKASSKVNAAALKFGIDVAKEAAVAVAAVAKDTGTDDGTDGMDPTVAMGPEPDGDYPGSATDPGSPLWEAQDASNAQKWLAIGARMKNALGVMAEREMLEAAGADPSDCENAWDLEDAQCVMDYVLATLAVFAASEQAEADLCSQDMMAAIGKGAGVTPETFAAICKAMAAPELPGALAVIETFGVIRKSGRVLSAVNEAHLREAHARLNTVLSSLPSAPATDDGQPVAKTEGTTVTATATETEPVAKETAPAGEAPDAPDETPAAAREVVKSASLLAPVYDQYGTLTGVTSPAKILQQVAKADDGDGKVTMQAVFDESGNLVGIVDPADITPVSGAGSKPADDSTEAPAPDADPDSMTPQPPAEAGTPADAVTDDTVTKQDGTLTLTQDVLKSILADVFTSGLGAQPAQDIAKQVEVAGLAAQVEKLMAEVEVLKEQPAVPKVFTAGAAPPDGAVPPPRAVLRGQDQDAQVNVTKAAEMRAQWTAEQDPAIANQRANAMQQRAIDGLSAIHGRA